jgi:inosine-uridine nucleoside N-ribohydrolase
MLRIWVDTDIGGDIDDAVALLCAARHPGVDLIGVSTVYGRVDAKQWLARELLVRAGLDVPRLRGCSAAPAVVLAGAVMPVRGRSPDEKLYSYERLAPADLPTMPPREDEARLEAIASAMRALGPFDLVTIGPLTNIGRLISRDPTIVGCWRTVTCMAGRLEGEPEYNVFCDPAAAEIAFRKTNPRLVGLEACSDTLPRREVEALLDTSDPASVLFLECYRAYRSREGEDKPDDPLTLFDPIALLSLIAPQAFDFQPVRIAMDREGRMRLTDDGFPVSYALSSDWAQVRPLIERLLGPRSGWAT